MKMRRNPGTEVFAQTALSPDEAAGTSSKGATPSQSLSARNRRRFLKGGMFAAGATVLGAGLSPSRLLASEDDDRTPTTKGDIAILRFFAGPGDVPPSSEYCCHRSVSIEVRDSYQSISIPLSMGYVLRLKKYPQMYPQQGEARAMIPSFESAFPKPSVVS